MNRIQQAVKAMDDRRLVEIIVDFEKFEEQGHIGNCALRTEAEKVAETLGEAGQHVVLWMDRLAFEAYRELYLRSQKLLAEARATLPDMRHTERLCARIDAALGEKK